MWIIRPRAPRPPSALRRPRRFAAMGCLAALLGWGCGQAAPASAAALEVVVRGVRNDHGVMRLCLWSAGAGGAPDGFPDCTRARAGVMREVKPAAPGDIRFRFPTLAAGVYAVTVFHDERNAGTVDTNFLGIPRDGLGASNDPKARFGPPSFDAAAFRVGAADGQITLLVVYP